MSDTFWAWNNFILKFILLFNFSMRHVIFCYLYIFITYDVYSTYFENFWITYFEFKLTNNNHIQQFTDLYLICKKSYDIIPHDVFTWNFALNQKPQRKINSSQESPDLPLIHFSVVISLVEIEFGFFQRILFIISCRFWITEYQEFVRQVNKRKLLLACC